MLLRFVLLYKDLGSKYDRLPKKCGKSPNVTLYPCRDVYLKTHTSLCFELSDMSSKGLQKDLLLWHRIRKLYQT